MTAPSTLPSPCEQTILALPWLLNGSLEPQERRQVREHLIHCPPCRAELARTSETLAMFRDAAAREQPAREAAAGTSRFAGRGNVLRRLAWAAMIAAVLAAVGVTWRGATRPADETATPTLRAERSPVGRGAEPSMRERVTTSSVPTSVPTSVSTTVASLPAPRPIAGAAPSRQPARGSAPTQVKPEIISVASFESGTVGPLMTGSGNTAGRRAAEISTMDFENGAI